MTALSRREQRPMAAEAAYNRLRTSVDLGWVERTVTRGDQSHNAEYLEARRDEYLKFLVICALNPGQLNVPSDEVDEFWHAHLADGDRYDQDCLVGIGVRVTHNPGFGIGDPALLRMHAVQTVGRYRECFGDPPEIFWDADNAAACSGCVIPAEAA